MKKDYAAPSAELVKFEYKDQVVASSGRCGVRHSGSIDPEGHCMGPSPWKMD